jgi:hypothetical protein
MGNNCPIMESAAYTWQRGKVDAADASLYFHRHAAGLAPYDSGE